MVVQAEGVDGHAQRFAEDHPGNRKYVCPKPVLDSPTILQKPEIAANNSPGSEYNRWALKPYRVVGVVPADSTSGGSSNGLRGVLNWFFRERNG